MKVSPLVLHLEGAEGCEILTRFTDHQSGILLCLAGLANFTIGGRQSEMRPGDMLIIVPFTNLTFEQLDADFKGVLCVVDFEDVFSAITPIAPINLIANMQFIILHPLSRPSDTDAETLIALINLIEQRSLVTGNRPLSDIATSNLLNVLAYLVLDSYMNVNQTVTNCSDTKESIMFTFHANLTRDFTKHRQVAHYAKLQNLTPRYFSTVIKTVSGYTPIYWINTVVASEAKRLMRNSKMSIKEIAYYLNFASPTFFTRWYRNYTGETPSEYRNRFRITLAQKS